MSLNATAEEMPSMTADYIRSTYATASNELDEARVRYAEAKTQRARRDAAEDVEFWLSKKSTMWAAARCFEVEL